MKWINRFLGLEDKKREAREIELDLYIEQKKQEYIETMKGIAREAKEVHESAKMTHRKSKDLYNNITNKIARASGGERRGL